MLLIIDTPKLGSKALNESILTANRRFHLLPRYSPRPAQLELNANEGGRTDGNEQPSKLFWGHTANAKKLHLFENLKVTGPSEIPKLWFIDVHRPFWQFWKWKILGLKVF